MKNNFKRFLVFYSQNYYPLGGIDDLQDSFNTLEEAKENIKENIKNCDPHSVWAHIFDTQDRQLIRANIKVIYQSSANGGNWSDPKSWIIRVSL